VKTYNDYPEAASNAAKRVLKWVEENGWGSCLTPVGKKRARQLANREPISRDTIARMASFARHLQYKDVPFNEGCGGLAVAAWGGEAGILWAKRKLKEIDSKKYFGFDINKSIETDIKFFTPEMIQSILDKLERDNVYSMTLKQLMEYTNYSAPINQLNNDTYKVFVEGIGNVELKTSQYYPFSPQTTNRLIRANVNDFTKSKSFYVTSKLIDTSKQFDNLDDFRLKAYSIMDQYYNEFGNVELDVMVRKVDAAKQMADWWSDDKIDLIQFRTQRDNRVRPSHSQLEGITRPKTDKFWIKYSPPLEYNCRCVLRPVKEGITTKPTAQELEITESQVHKDIRLSTIYLLKENSIRSLIGNDHPYLKLYDKYKNI